MLPIVAICVFKLQPLLAGNSQGDKAAQQIRELKQGTLIVLLDFRTKTQKTYRDNGLNDIADRIQAEQLKFNRELVQAIRESYHFSHFLFLRKEDFSEAVRSRSGGMFLNNELQPDTGIKLRDSFIYLLDFGYVYQNSESYSPASDAANAKNNQAAAGNTTPSVSECFIIKDSLLNQLVDPFPFYVRKKFNLTKAVSRLNDRLETFYNDRAKDR